VLPLKPEIERHLKERFTTLFDAQYDLLLYDVTSTYFEGEAAANPQAQRGYSRDGRPDCKQVCIGLVVTREGLPVGYKVFDGNRTDVTTVEDIVSTMEALHGCIDRIWVMDRGMVSEDNLTWLRTEGRRYIVGTPKAWLRRFERPLLEEGWTEVQPGVEVKCCPAPEGAETFILCRSEARREKERAMHARFEQRLEAGLKKLAGRLDRAKRKPDRAQVERQIGRLLARNSRAAALFEVRTVEVERDGRKGHLKLEWNKREEHRQWWALSEGAYLLRTNLPDWPAEELWRSYIHLTQVESAFRVEKSDLSLRPIWHQLEHRVQAHVLFSYLAYAMWKTLELWMARSDLGNSPRMLLEELARIKSQDVILPTSAGRDVRVRCVRKPDDSQELLLDRLGLQLPLRVSEPRWCK
jgi:transposase